jgi:hypothetical protein
MSTSMKAIKTGGLHLEEAACGNIRARELRPAIKGGSLWELGSLRESP